MHGHFNLGLFTECKHNFIIQLEVLSKTFRFFTRNLNLQNIIHELKVLRSSVWRVPDTRPDNFWQYPIHTQLFPSESSVIGYFKKVAFLHEVPVTVFGEYCFCHHCKPLSTHSMRSYNRDVGKARFKIMPIILHFANIQTSYQEMCSFVTGHLCHNNYFDVYDLRTFVAIYCRWDLHTFAISWYWKVTSGNWFAFLVNPTRPKVEQAYPSAPAQICRSRQPHVNIWNISSIKTYFVSSDTSSSLCLPCFFTQHKTVLPWATTTNHRCHWTQ